MIRQHKTILLIGIIVLTISCGGVGLLAQRAGTAIFVLPMSQDIQTDWQRLGVVHISYRTNGEPFAWRGQLGRQLTQLGWEGRSFTNMGAHRPPFITIWYSRNSQVGPLILRERAVFGNHPDDPLLATIEVTREFELRR